MCFLIAIALMLRSFWLFDLLLQRLYHVYPDLWKAYGCPTGHLHFHPERDKRVRWWEFELWWKPIASRDRFLGYLLDPRNELPDWIAELPPMVTAAKKLRGYHKASWIAMVCCIILFSIELLMDYVF